MKNSVRQTVLSIICIIIICIPTIIAVTYYCTEAFGNGGNRYSIEIITDSGDLVTVDDHEVDSIAKLVLKMNSKLSPTSVDPNSLQSKYYMITIKDKSTVSSYKYYFSTDQDAKTIVQATDGTFYSLRYKDVKQFLSRGYAYMFYRNSALPTLSINGGSDIIPMSADWKFKTVNGTFVRSPAIKTTPDSGIIYAMSGSTKLSFSTAPDKCSVKVYQNGKEIASSNSLDGIPYDLLDSSSLSFNIQVEWSSSSEYRGSASYKFSSSIGIAPEFIIDDREIVSGEFFTVTGLNVSAPQKIAFSSVPSINFDPIFFADGNVTHALIPIGIDLPVPMTYTFTFTYGESVSEIQVSVKERNIEERNYSCNISRSEAALKEYSDLVTSITSKYESTKYFGEKFIDYTDYYSAIATYNLGFGHLRIPDNGDDPYRLDGVDYLIISGTDIPTVCAGKVVYVGKSALLGNFVVVDHGFGLKTWYCHMSETTAVAGTIVSRGEVIGKSGSSGYTNSNGVYLITTVKDVPISPYPIQDNGIIFPEIS